jgi:hypothetical protein
MYKYNLHNIGQNLNPRIGIDTTEYDKDPQLLSKESKYLLLISEEECVLDQQLQTHHIYKHIDAFFCFY